MSGSDEHWTIREAEEREADDRGAKALDAAWAAEMAELHDRLLVAERERDQWKFGNELLLSKAREFEVERDRLQARLEDAREALVDLGVFDRVNGNRGDSMTGGISVSGHRTGWQQLVEALSGGEREEQHGA